MTELRIPDVGQKSKGDDHMGPPPKAMPAEEAAFGDANAAEDDGNHRADR